MYKAIFVLLTGAMVAVRDVEALPADALARVGVAALLARRDLATFAARVRHVRVVHV